MIDIENIISIIAFILPGYLVIYFIMMISEYLKENDILERIVHYLFFGIFCP